MNRRRQNYAWIAGAALWGTWLLSIVLGSQNVDLAGQIIGTDYLEFYAAGTTVRQGESARLYDMAYQAQLQQTIIGPQLRGYYGFITPPFLAWLFVPFSALSYLWSFALWSVLGLIALGISLRLLGAPQPGRAALWSLTWFPVFATISFGQNSLLSVLILSLVYYLWRTDRQLAAGLAASCLLYKPQLLIGILLLWLATRKKRGVALIGLVTGGCILAALSFWQMPEASREYVIFVRTVLPALPDWQQYPLWHLHTVWGFWRMLLPEARPLANGLYAVITTAGIAGFVYVCRQLETRPALQFASAICLTLWITPHAMIYDWAVLLIPAVILWRETPELRQEWRFLFATLWCVSFLSGSLAALQLRWLPFAVQISVPFLVFVICRIYYRLQKDGLTTNQINLP